MPDDLIAYVQSPKLTDWKRIAIEHATGDIPCFIYGSDDDRQFQEYAKRGATLWVIESQPDAPPSLVARLTGIRRVGLEVDTSELPTGVLLRFRRKKKGRLERYSAYVLGDDESVFLPHNDASHALCQLWLEHKGGPRRITDTTRKGRQIGRRWWTGYGSRLLRPRRVVGWSRGRRRTIVPGAEPLVELAQRTLNRSVFISWKHRDLKRPWGQLRQLVAALIREGFGCWWDALALPDSRSLRALKARGADRDMERLLRYGLAQSRVLLAHASPHYGHPSASSGQNWTQGEWDQASARIEPWRVVYPWVESLVEQTMESERCCVDLRDCAHRIPPASPSTVARKLARWLDAQPPSERERNV